MKIQVGGLSQGSHSYSFQVEPREIGLDERFTGTVDVTVELEKTPTQVELMGRASAEGRFACDRCAEEFTQALKGSWRMHYLWNETEAAQWDPSEVQIVPPTLAVIDLGEDVRQTLILAVPLKLLCRPECKGLCPQCGTNLNQATCNCSSEPGDSRWDALRALRSN